MYDLHRLRLLRELSYRGTLAAVATALGYSPSAISHQLSLLEREVKAPLLEPAGRGVRLTPAAMVLVERTEVILSELERAAAEVAAARGDLVGTLRVATFQTAARTVVLDAIDELAERHPSLEVAVVHLDAAAAIPALLARDFDLVLSEDYPGAPSAPHRGVSTAVIADDPLQLVIPAQWEARELSELAAVPWVMEHPGTAARAWASATCRAAGFEPRVLYETTDLTLHAAIVARGRTAAFLPALTPESSWRGIRLLPTGQARTISLSVRAGGEEAPAIRAFREAVTALR